MSNKLENIFNNYIELAKSRFDELNLQKNVKGPLRIITNKSLEIRRIVDQLEKEAVFQELVNETSSEFSWRYKPVDPWDFAIGNFFRRSNYYYNIFQGKTINHNNLFNQYTMAFSRDKISVTYLAPVLGIKFVDNIIDVGDFQLIIFSIDELESLFHNKTKEIFCPEIAFDMDLIDELKKLWFIKYVREYSPQSLGLSIYCAWDRYSSILINDNDVEDWYDEKYSYAEGILEGNLPEPIINVLKVVALFDLQSDTYREQTNHLANESDVSKGTTLYGKWKDIKIPFVILLDDNLLSSSCISIPEIYRIKCLSYYNEDEISLDKEETYKFKNFINNIGKLITLIEDDQNKWQFLEIALTSMVKAFLTEGLEQLLWHMISLEALLGEKGEGITVRLARRISNILGRNESERERIRKQFKELYNFRCEIAHGNPFTKRVYTGHLWVARDLCRKILLWFINYLSAIQIKIKNRTLENIPSREDILTLIDQDPTSRKHLTFLLENLPEDFPYVKEWIR